MKRNKGITLIALVVTIIVLLILAGVAIAMLSGENGILRKAAEAKTKTEEAQKEENTTLIDMELDSYFITNNLKYKCRYGYITGIDIGDAAGELNSILNGQGYKLRNVENTADVADDTKLRTGMTVIKDNEIVARTVIFGDTNSKSDNINISIKDFNRISYYIDNKLVGVEEYEIIAMDINHDGYIDKNDEKELLKYNASASSLVTKQDVYATKLKNVTRLSDKDIIKKIGICNPNNIEFDEGNKHYKVILDKEYTYKEISNKINVIYPTAVLEFIDNNEEKEISITSEEKVQKTDWLEITLEKKLQMIQYQKIVTYLYNLISEDSNFIIK